MNQLVRKEKEFNQKLFKAKVIAIAIAVLVLVIGILVALVVHFLDIDSNPTEIGFEDIGELNTQSACVTVVNTISDPRKLFGVNIPLTESKYIYSYNVIVKAGLDFSKIKWKVKNETIVVNLPKPKVTSCYIDEESMQIYLEKESIFSPITLNEEQEARLELTKKGKKAAIDNGLFENTKDNAEVLLTALFKKNREYKDYEIEFNWEKL